MTTTRLTLAALLAVILAGSTVQAQNWPRWRGPNSNGTAESDAKGPSDISAASALLWKAELPGKGASTPIVWNDHIILTAGTGATSNDQDSVVCYDWNGKERWMTKIGTQRLGKHKRASGSCPSAVTDGERIFVYYKSGNLAALDFKGKILWKTNLQDRFGKDSLWWDLGTSPVLADDNVVVAVMHEGKSYMVALNKETGDLDWKVDRNYDCPKETSQAYTTPTVINDGKKTSIVVWGADHLTAHDATTGKTIWECGGFNPKNKGMWRVIASASISDGIAIVPYGRSQYLAGIKLGGKGNITKKARLWENKGMGSDASTPAASDGKAYIVNFKGKVLCVDMMSGKTVWESDLPTGKGVFYSSPLLAGDKLYICRENGTVYACQISTKGMKVLSTAQFDDNFAASPILIDGKLLLRGEKNLYCLSSN